MSERNDEARRSYTPPTIEPFGTITELTRVGQTNPGQDSLPGARGKDQGSVDPPGLD